MKEWITFFVEMSKIENKTMKILEMTLSPYYYIFHCYPPLMPKIPIVIFFLTNK